MLVKAPQNESCSWEMYRAYYLQWESSPWSSGTLHHFLFEMYGTFKKGKRSFPLTHGAPKWTNSYLAVDEAELKVYVSTLFELLVSDKRKFLPRSWWSVEVVSMLLGLYLQYNAQWDGDQSRNELNWGNGIGGQKQVWKQSKKQWGRAYIKHKKEEEEQANASKNRQMVAESSVMLSPALGITLTTLIASRSDNEKTDN